MLAAGAAPSAVTYTAMLSMWGASRDPRASDRVVDIFRGMIQVRPLSTHLAPTYSNPYLAPISSFLLDVIQVRPGHVIRPYLFQSLSSPYLILQVRPGHVTRHC
jgi:hypothetical protein